MRGHISLPARGSGYLGVEVERTFVVLIDKDLIGLVKKRLRCGRDGRHDAQAGLVPAHCVPGLLEEISLIRFPGK